VYTRPNDSWRAQRGRRKPDSYQAMSPKLLNWFEMAGTAVPMMVLSYTIVSLPPEA
jgi:hypothetical protein